MNGKKQDFGNDGKSGPRAKELKILTPEELHEGLEIDHYKIILHNNEKTITLEERIEFDYRGGTKGINLSGVMHENGFGNAVYLLKSNYSVLYREYKKLKAEKEAFTKVDFEIKREISIYMQILDREHRDEITSAAISSWKNTQSDEDTLRHMRRINERLRKRLPDQTPLIELSNSVFSKELEDSLLKRLAELGLGYIADDDRKEYGYISFNNPDFSIDQLGDSEVDKKILRSYSSNVKIEWRTSL